MSKACRKASFATPFAHRSPGGECLCFAACTLNMLDRWGNIQSNIENPPEEYCMFRLFTLMLAFCVPMVMLSYAAKADGQPSPGAQGMPGAKGTFEFKPDDWTQGATTWWKDTDGVDPGMAGCHIGTDSKGTPDRLNLRPPRHILTLPIRASRGAV